MYLLDANVFIEAKRRYYGFDFCPAFWNWIEMAYENGLVRSIKSVRSELIGKDKKNPDELSLWSQNIDGGFFVDPDQQTLASLGSIVNWSLQRGYQDAAVADFAKSADAFLVAHAHAHNSVVVTQERPSDSLKKVKIPDACEAFGVEWMNTFSLLRREQAVFVLE